MQAWWKVMAAYRRVYDSRHLHADWLPRTGISSGTLRSVIEYGLPLPPKKTSFRPEHTNCINNQNRPKILTNLYTDIITPEYG